MKLSENTLKLLNNYATINNGICIRAAKTDKGTEISTIAIDKSTYSSALISEVFEKDVYLYDLGLVLGSLKTFSDAEIKLDEDKLIISQDGNQLKVTYADPSNIIYSDKNPKLPDPALSFTISEESLDKVQKFANMLSAPYLRLEKQGSSLIITTAEEPERDSSSANQFSVDLGEVEYDKDFSLVMQVSTLKLIPGDYDVTIHILNGKAIANFEQVGSLQNLKYIVPLHPKSVWTE